MQTTPWYCFPKRTRRGNEETQQHKSIIRTNNQCQKTKVFIIDRARNNQTKVTSIKGYSYKVQLPRIDNNNWW